MQLQLERRRMAFVVVVKSSTRELSLRQSMDLSEIRISDTAVSLQVESS